MIDTANDDVFFAPMLSSYPAIADNPHITLPLATVAGLPLGISLIGQRFADHRLAQIAYRLEQQTPLELAVKPPVSEVADRDN
jgi:amidase